MHAPIVRENRCPPLAPCPVRNLTNFTFGVPEA